MFIAHDLGVVKHVSDRIAVMYLGTIVELTDAESLYEAPAHPYTEALLSAAPDVDDGTTELRRERIVLTGDVPNPVDRPSGCLFHTRCPYTQDVCVTDRPPLADVPQDGRWPVTSRWSTSPDGPPSGCRGTRAGRCSRVAGSGATVRPREGGQPAGAMLPVRT